MSGKDNIKKIMKHNTIYNKKLDTYLDEKIVPLVELLNEIPDLRTVSSCQGFEEDKWGHIFFYYKDYTDLADLIFGKFAPALRKELGEDIRLEMVQYSDEYEKPVMGVIAFPTCAIPFVYEILKKVV